MIGKLAGNYRIKKEIGTGGMGTVYLAHHVSLKFNNRQPLKVAIKILHPHLVKSEQIKERFLQEAKTQFQLSHKGITKVIDYNEDENGLYIVLEYLEGDTLEQYISKVRGLIPEKESKQLFLEILDAVKFAHNNKIIHRDLKPSNIMITREGDVKIMDFGIAKVIDYDKSLTKTGSKLGSPAYMSPEQVLGKTTDHRSDIYSLGVIYFEMLTGKPAYNKKDTTEFEIYNSIVKKPLPRLKSFYEHISPGAQTIIDKATAKDPESRFQSINEFQEAILNSRSIKVNNRLEIKHLVYSFGILLIFVFSFLGYKLYQNPERTGNVNSDNAFLEKHQTNQELVFPSKMLNKIFGGNSSKSTIYYEDKFCDSALFDDSETSYGSYTNYSAFAQIKSVSSRNPFQHVAHFQELNTVSNFLIETEIRIDPCNSSLNHGECSTGFILGNENFYFLIFYNGYMELTNYNPGSEEHLILDESDKFVPFFEQGKNYRIQILFKNNNINVSINNQEYLNTYLKKHPGNTFGFIAQQGAKTEIFNFIINGNKNLEL
jgi:serine/threonine protein kinase